MSNNNKDLSMQEIPLHSLSNLKPHLIFVSEGDDQCQQIYGSVNFSEAGGGISVNLQKTIRNVCWRTSGNRLEIFEYSLEVDLYAASFVIVFEKSKVLPWVHLAYVSNKLCVACCTAHALHNIVLEAPNIGRSTPSQGTPMPSLLSNLDSFDFDDPSNNCYFLENSVMGDMLTWTANTVASDSSNQDGICLMSAILTKQGNMNLIKMTGGILSMECVNQASRISRVFAGINPWGDAGGTETIVDFQMVTCDLEAFVIAICRDRKLRIWSFESNDLILTHDLSPQFKDCNDANILEDYKIRFCAQSQTITVLADIGDQAWFVQFKVEFALPGRVSQFDEFSTTSATTSRNGVHCHLVDFTYSHNMITAVWRDTEENEFISICESDSGVWRDVALHPAPPAEVPLLPMRDIRESFMDHIFAPGKFSPSAILRTLSIQPRHNLSVPSSIWDLKEKVAAHIQNEIERMMPEEGVNDDAVQVAAWNNLYEKLVQYQQVVSRTVGITNTQCYDQCNSTIIKTGCVCVLAPVSELKSVCNGSNLNILRSTFALDQYSDSDLADVMCLLLSLRNLREGLGDEFMESLLLNIRVSDDSAHEVIGNVVPEIVSAGIDEPEKLFERITDLHAAIVMLLDFLEPVDCGSDMDIPDNPAWPAGSYGAELIAHCVLRHLEYRFELSTLLLIAMSVFQKLQENNPFDVDFNLVSRAKGYIDAYRSLEEISSTMSQSISQGSLDTKLQTLSLSDSYASNIDPEIAKKRTLAIGSNKSILEYFISGSGGKLMKGLLSSQDCDGDLLLNGMITFCVKSLVYLLWPCGPTLALPDFMLSHCQFTALQKYLQKSVQWCSWCTKSKQYMLAYCHMHAGKFAKAVKSFIAAAPGIIEEEYMSSRLLNEDEEALPQAAKEILYFTKVLPIFEKLDLPEQVLAIAHKAIECTRLHDYDENLPILWSSVFRQSNLLARHNDALKAIMHNPNHQHRKDCLRTFTISLCESKEYKTLVELQYGNLEDELVDILQHRSRGTDVSIPEHQYYNLLYAFHVQRGNFKRAASAMYEQTFQISQGLSKSEAITERLEQMLNCLSACINCLYLVDYENRWILHPSGESMPTGNALDQRSDDPTGFQASVPKQSKVIVHELEDIKKELKLVEMKIKLLNFTDEFPPSSLESLNSAKEISSFLCHAGLYDDAISLCTTFRIPIVHVFESLASKAVRLSFADERTSLESWEWLQHNETVKRSCIGGRSSFGNWTSADVAYRLLQVYLETYDCTPGRGTACFQATGKILMSFSATLPAWFVNAYKIRNHPELLRLLVCYDRLEEAASLAVEMIQTAKAKLHTQFDVDPSKRKVIYLPSTVIEHLLCILENSAELVHLYHTLSEALCDYLDRAKVVSDDVSRMRRMVDVTT